ncbi:signal peptidase II [uncultured Roseibium sp.]|uniref:signal peptidase II n=1 Tax=uncultured Roseibium sp. TaxID=1936171 RepID=UPI00262D8E4E|nr:signal peptidase II [uncultured Roseibium sp.]
MSELDNTSLNTSKRPLFWGRFSAFVLIVVLICVLVDQGTKIWLVHGFDLAANGPVQVLPYLDIVLVWNRGISYGLFQQNSDFGRWLLAGLTVVVSIGLWIWSTRCDTKLVALALALVIGGAVGNGIDRLSYGAVVDFVHFHVGTFSWYVFNMADVWIVAGVVGLLYDSFRNGPNSAAK